MDIDNIMDYGFNIALNMYRNLTGDYDTVFDSTEDIYTEIDKNFDSGDGFVNVESLDVNITDNGTYTYEKTLDIDGYNPVRVSVELNTETYYQNGYNDGYGVGEGVGYGNGVTAGKDEQKALLEETTFKDNGVYEKEDGWKRVSVEVDTPTFETETLSVELTDNGNYSYTPTKDGFGSVDVTVNVAPSGGGGGFDFSVLGYDTSTTDELNSSIQDDIDYGLSVAGKLGNKTSAAYLFQNDSKLVYCPSFPVSHVTNVNYMFSNCTALKYVPDLEMPKLTNTYNMFDGCSSLNAIGKLTFGKLTNMSNMFNTCKNLQSLPLEGIDTSNVTNMDSAFYDCMSLTDVPEIDCGMVTQVGYLTGISIQWKNCVNFGGFKNLGAQSTLSGSINSYFLQSCNKLTHDSLMNIINGLYDRAAAGYSNITLKFGYTNMNKLTDEEKAIATNKGWTLTT